MNSSENQSQEQGSPCRILVIGAGGAGNNAVNNMIEANLQGVEFVVANTDHQALLQSLCQYRIQLGRQITAGLGAGGKPEMGRKSAEEAVDEIVAAIQNTNMLFIAAGMGGGTGTGAAPVIARIAREAGILTVGVVTKPFDFEGRRRMAMAEEGLAELRQNIDALVVVPNQNLFVIANENTTFAEAFKLSDDVLYCGVRSITEVIQTAGTVNLDFADVRAIMSEMGQAMMGTGEADGSNRAIDAAEAAISSPLLDNTSIHGARAALVHISGSADVKLHEVDAAQQRIKEELDGDANIIWGFTFDPALEGLMRVSVIATGIDGQDFVRKAPAQVEERAGAATSLPGRPRDWGQPGTALSRSPSQPSERVEPVLPEKTASPVAEPAPAEQTGALTGSPQLERQPPAVINRVAGLASHLSSAFSGNRGEVKPAAPRGEAPPQAMTESVEANEAVARPQHFAGNFRPGVQRNVPLTGALRTGSRDPSPVAGQGNATKLGDGMATSNLAGIEKRGEARAVRPSSIAGGRSGDGVQDDTLLEIPTFLRRQAN